MHLIKVTGVDNPVPTAVSLGSVPYGTLVRFESGGYRESVIMRTWDGAIDLASPGTTWSDKSLRVIPYATITGIALTTTPYKC